MGTALWGTDPGSVKVVLAWHANAMHTKMT
jgi:hypothetical protein